jgi:hypothetical protein
MRLRCDSTTSSGHTCSLILDWLGHHPGDHRAHERHDLARPVLAAWPNTGQASQGVPVHAAAPAQPAAPAPAPVAAPRRAAAPVTAARPARRGYEEITEWDLLPDA